MGLYCSHVAPRVATGRSAICGVHSIYIWAVAKEGRKVPALSHIGSGNPGNRVHDKTLSHSVRYVRARKPAFATSSTPSLSAWSCRNIALRRESLQDGVRLALTEQKHAQTFACHALHTKPPSFPHYR